MKKLLFILTSTALLGLSACSSVATNSSFDSASSSSSATGSSSVMESSSSEVSSESSETPSSISEDDSSSDTSAEPSSSTMISEEPSSSSSESESSLSSSSIEQDEELPTYSASITGLTPVNSLGQITETLVTEEEGMLHEVTGDETLTGVYPNGVYITTAKEEKVTITLNGATIYGNRDSENADILGRAVTTKNKKSKVHLYLAPGTENYIYNDCDDTNAVHIKGDLFIEGPGHLTVISGKKNALKATADIKIKEEANVTVKAAGDAIHGEKVTIDHANVDVKYAGKDGIQAEADSDYTTWSEDTGFVKFNEAHYTSLSMGDGIQADTFAEILGGEVDIKTQGLFVTNTTENKALYELTSDDFKWNKSGNAYRRASSDRAGSPWGGGGSSGSYALAYSSKGIKIGAMVDASGNDIATTSYSLNVDNGACISVSSSDDGIHVNYGDVSLHQSNVTIQTGDDGIHADHIVSIYDGAEVEIKDSYEGIEGSKCLFEGGVTKVAAYDDGVNAASDIYSELLLENNGGVLEVRASGDGLDSNGDMNFNAGITTVMGPTQGGNGPLDCGDRNKVSFHGGDVLTVSNSQMLETNSYNTNSQCYAIVVSGINVSEGNLIELLDASSEVVLKGKATCSGQAIVVSSPKIKAGQYTLKYGSTSKTVNVTSKITTSGTSGGGGRPW